MLAAIHVTEAKVRLPSALPWQVGSASSEGPGSSQVQNSNEPTQNSPTSFNAWTLPYKNEHVS